MLITDISTKIKSIMAKAIEQIYNQLMQVLGGTNPNQIFCMTIPGTTLTQSDYAYDLSKEKPHLVTEAESRLVDQMFDLAQITGSSNGQKLSSQYMQALRVLIPKFDPMMPIVKNQLRTYLNSPAPFDASVNGVAFTGNLEQYYFALYEDWLAKKSAWEQKAIAYEKANTPEDYLEWYEGIAEGELAIIDAAMGRLLSVFSPSDMDAVLGALAAGPGGELEEAATQVLDLRLPSPSGGYIYPIDLTPSDWFLNLASDDNPENLLNDPQFIAITIAARRQAIQASISQVQSLLSQAPSASDLQKKTSALQKAQSDYTNAQNNLINTYSANTAMAVEMYLTDGVASGGSDEDTLNKLNENAVEVSKAKGETPQATGATKKGGLPITTDDVKQILDGQNKLVQAQSDLLNAAQNVANMGQDLVAAQAQTFAGLPVILSRLQSQLTDLQSIQAQLGASSNTTTPPIPPPAIITDESTVTKVKAIAITPSQPLDILTGLYNSMAGTNSNTNMQSIYNAAYQTLLTTSTTAINKGVNDLGTLISSAKAAAAAAMNPTPGKSASATDILNAVLVLIPQSLTIVKSTSIAQAAVSTLLNFADVNGIVVGMPVTGAGIPTGATVASVDAIAKTVTISIQTSPLVPVSTSITFYDVSSIVKNTSKAQTAAGTTLDFSDVSGLSVGMACYSDSDISTGTKILSIDNSTNTVTLSQPTTGIVAHNAEIIFIAPFTPEQTALQSIANAAATAETAATSSAASVNAAVMQQCDKLWNALKDVASAAQSASSSALPGSTNYKFPTTVPTTILTPVNAAVKQGLTNLPVEVKSYFLDSSDKIILINDSTLMSLMNTAWQSTATRYCSQTPPAKVSKAGTSDYYMSFEMSFQSDDMDQDSSSSSMSSSTSWSVSLFFGSASGSNSNSSAASSNQSLETNTEIKIGFKAAKVDINRGWFDPGVFKLTTDMNRISTVAVSSGTVDFGALQKAQSDFDTATSNLDQANSHLKTNPSDTAAQQAVAAAQQALNTASTNLQNAKDAVQNANAGIMPCFPVAFVIAKDVNIQFQASRSQLDAVKSVLDSRSAVGGGFLCFSASSASAAHSEASSVHSKTEDTVINISMPGPQILGWFLESTPVDNSQHMVTAATPPGQDLNIMEFVAALNKLS